MRESMPDVGDKPRLDILSFGLYALMESCIVRFFKTVVFRKDGRQMLLCL